MNPNFTDLRVSRDIGGLITVYFEFLKANFKNYLNVFISYNAIFILAFLVISYLIVSNYAGLITPGNFTSFDEEGGAYGAHLWLAVMGSSGFIILYLITALLNYSLAASYVILYVERQGGQIDKQSVWGKVKSKIGHIILFIILISILYIGVIFVGNNLLRIPVIGLLAFYCVILGFMGWAGLSFMALMEQNIDVSQALSEGWKLITKNFWKVILSHLVISLLLIILMAVIMIIPAIVMVFFLFISTNDIAVSSYSTISLIVTTLVLCVIFVVYIFQQSILQMISGVIYYSLREEIYNEAARERIDQIGKND